MFAAPGAVTSAQLAAALDISVREVDKGLADLEAQFKERGLRLQRHFGRVQLTTAPEAAASVEKFLGLEASSHLSRAALETLAIIAYQQPVTRPEIDCDPRGQQRWRFKKPAQQRIGARSRPRRKTGKADPVQHHPGFPGPFWVELYRGTAASQSAGRTRKSSD